MNRFVLYFVFCNDAKNRKNRIEFDNEKELPSEKNN